MKIMRPCLIPLIAMSLMSVSLSVSAGEEAHRDYKHHKMQKHHQSMQEVHGILREVMVILRDLNHKPAVTEKNRLNSMINRLDKIMEERKEMRKNGMKGKHHQWKNSDSHHNSGHDDEDE